MKSIVLNTYLKCLNICIEDGDIFVKYRIRIFSNEGFLYNITVVRDLIDEIKNKYKDFPVRVVGRANATELARRMLSGQITEVREDFMNSYSYIMDGNRFYVISAEHKDYQTNGSVEDYFDKYEKASKFTVVRRVTDVTELV